MSMYNKMKEKAIPATNYKRSNGIVKTISKAETVELFRQLEPISAQNNREYNTGLEALERDGSYYNGENLSVVSPIDAKPQKLEKKL